jgi:aspartyl-tRNA(Asn)/glutamyl-tRNA(Gln) amidotransferase subunit C
MPVSRQEVLHVARLARLHLSDDQLELFTAQLNDILAHVTHLAAVEVSGQDQPDSMVDWPAPLRADQPGADEISRPAVQLSSHSRSDLFTVPRLAALDGDLA